MSAVPMAYAFSKFSRLFLYKSSNLCCLCSNCCDKDVICHNKTYNWTIVIRQMLWTRNIHKVDIYKDSRKIWKQLFWMSKFLYCNTVCNPFQGIVFFFMELVQSRLSSKFSYNVAFFVFTKSHYQYRYDWFISENNIENVIGYSKYWKTFLGRY